MIKNFTRKFFSCILYDSIKVYNTVTSNTIYLDMDGVVADFRAAAERVIGPPPSSFDSSTGVGGDIYPDADWERFRDSDPHLFLHLPLVPRAHELVDLARQYRDQLGWELLFLTAIPHNNDMPWVFHDKAAWVRIHFPDIAVHFGPYSTDKFLHCKNSNGSSDILVDDRLDNCRDWERAGGLAFRVGRTLDLTLNQLSQDLQERIDHSINQRRLVLDIL